ncbi:hypothetical protein CASFOL_040471 [Castilleja foliolosa]|uniref:Uncharacterized protein n=1 Tax=Castilleja foliolosa TaxID=1961234 RepID=A0ABD3BBQ8_9LAMI
MLHEVAAVDDHPTRTLTPEEQLQDGGEVSLFRRAILDVNYPPK